MNTVQPTNTSAGGLIVPDESASQEYHLIVLPFIVLFGLCGNTISLVAIFHSRLRKMAANQYLIVLTIADSFFLFGIILVLFKVDYVGYVPCVLVEYVLMTASYVSSWSIASLTLERYMAIANPLKHVQYGHMSRWKLMACWVPLPFLLNLIQFLTLKPTSNEPNERKCGISNGGRLQMITEFADVLLCYLFPCCVVVVLNAVIASKVRYSEKCFHIGTSPTPSTTKKSYCTLTTSASTGSTTVAAAAVAASAVAPPPLRRPRQVPQQPQQVSISPQGSPKKTGGNSSPMRKLSTRTAPSSSVPVGVRTAGGSATGNPPAGTTRILLVVPVVYILLNTPFYMFRILDTVALNLFASTMFQFDGLNRNPVLAWCYNVAHYLYYVNFACDVIVYAFSSVNFRRTVLIVWRRIVCSRWTNGKDMEQQLNDHRCNTSTLAYQTSTKRLLPKVPCNGSNSNLYQHQQQCHSPTAAATTTRNGSTTVVLVAASPPAPSRPGSGQRISLEVEDGLVAVAKRTP